MADLTPAEQAIADMYMSDMDGALESGDTPMRRHWRQHAAGQGRRIVAVVRPVIEAEALTALADDLERAGMNGVDVSTIRVRANQAATVDRGEATG